MKLYNAYSKKEQKETGQAIARASRDNKPSPYMVEEGEDDYERNLHSARFIRPPISNPSNWYHLVPTKYNQVYKSVSTKHILGVDCAVAPQVRNWHNFSGAEYRAQPKFWFGLGWGCPLWVNLDSRERMEAGLYRTYQAIAFCLLCLGFGFRNSGSGK